MKENRINIAEILKDCPKGTKLWSPLFGEVVFEEIIYKNKILVTGKISKFKDVCFRECFTEFGKWSNNYDTECLIFPSKENRDWSTFKPKKLKFDPKTLQPFDKVLARMKYGMWYADCVSLPIDGLNNVPCVMGDKDFDTIIPYNDDTKHLLCTTDEAPEYYRYWED